jgi:hypothetical protein
VVAQGDHFQSQSHTETTGGTVGGSFSHCSSDSVPTANGGSFGTSDCAGSSFSIQLPTDGTSSGDEGKVSATFTAGIRLTTTPYPEAPAGSLVAVITRAGASDTASDPPALDIRVVQEDDVIVAAMPPALAGSANDGQLVVHLVVNDRTTKDDGSACPLNTSALQVAMTRSTPLGNVNDPQSVAAQLGKAMGDTLAAIETQAPLIIAAEELNSTEESALRADGWARLEQALQRSGIGVSGLPLELHQLFDAFLERELASLGRRAERLALQQQLMQVALQLDAITTQQRFSADQDSLLLLIPRWRLRDLSGIRLSGSANALSEALTSYAAPIFELRDPAGATNFRAQVASSTSQITTGLDITGPYEASVDSLTSFARSVVNTLGGAQFELPASQRRTIIVAIPRPGANWAGPWQTVSAVTAKAFWESVADAHGTLSSTATVTLSPSDIYSSAGGASRLSCMDLAPVVRHVGLYFDTNGNNAVLGALGMEVRGTAAITASVIFPVARPLVSFEPGDPAGVPIRPRALNGNTVNVLGDGQGNVNFGAWPDDLGAGAGISPFTSFQLNMQVFAPPATQDVQSVLTQTTALFFVFDVERQTANINATMPGLCD